MLNESWLMAILSARNSKEASMIKYRCDANVQSSVSDPAYAPVYGNKQVVVAKRIKFSWATSGKPGVFLMVEKSKLNIDKTYQRDQSKKKNSNHCARLGLEVIWRARGSDAKRWDVMDYGRRTSLLRDAFARRCERGAVHGV